MSMRWAVDEALRELDEHTSDAAVIELARSYADAIDSSAGRRLATLGPALLRALEELLLTPKARGTGKEVTDGLRSPLDELRARRAARLNGTAGLDSAAP